jgi:hypothetical protein
MKIIIGSICLAILVVLFCVPFFLLGFVVIAPFVSRKFRSDVVERPLIFTVWYVMLGGAVAVEVWLLRELLSGTLR